MDSIGTFFTNFWHVIVHAVIWCWDMLVNIFTSIVNYCFDKLCSLVEWIITHLGFNFSMFTDGLNYVGLPTQALYVLKQIGFDHMILMVSTAILIRVVFNLIPSWASRI